LARTRPNEDVVKSRATDMLGVVERWHMGAKTPQTLHSHSLSSACTTQLLPARHVHCQAEQDLL